MDRWNDDNEADDDRSPLDAVFEPRSIAVIGASEREGSLGRTVFKNLLDSGFAGRLDAVNRKGEPVFGRPCVKRLRELPSPPELAVIAIPAQGVEAVIDDCAAAGVRAAIILTAGFEQLGKDSAGTQRRILKKARESGLRVVGPNCLGVIRPSSKLNASFAATMARPGRIAFLSQSGALCTAVLDWSLTENVGFSAFASVGAMLDVDWADLIDHFGNDPQTECILAYVESVGEARSFLAAARRTALAKPIVVLKAGRTEAASRAAMSHTGALTGSDRVFDAAMQRVGVLRVDTLADLFHVAEALSKQPLPAGRRLTILTNAGGPGILATDALVRGGGELASLPPALVKTLDGILPPFWSRANPIDIIGDADPERFTRAVEATVATPESDALLVILTPQAMTDPLATAQRIVPTLQQADRPVMANWIGGPAVEAANELFNAARIPTFSFPETAARVFNHLWRYRDDLRCLYETPAVVDDIGQVKSRQARVAEILDDVARQQRSLLTEEESKRVLEAYGIPVTSTFIAQSAAEAATLANGLGFPVVLKLYSHTQTHKTEVGGVILDLNSGDEVQSAFERLRAAMDARGRASEFLGVSVQPMERRQGVELILGSAFDPQFGPCILFGRGGTLVEITGDQAVGIPPLNTTLARRLVDQTRIAAALKGFRQRPPVDLAALDRILVAFSQLITEHPRIRECDINPLLASAEGIVALDARLVLHAADLAPAPPALRPFPVEYIRNADLADGTEVLLRPLRLEDEPALARFHETLSESTVRERYFGLSSLSYRTDHQRLIRTCLNDFDSQMAIVAARPGVDEILAVGRLSRARRSDTADLSLIVSDDWQSKGLGRQMLALLIEIGRAEGLQSLTATMLTGNQAMLDLCQKHGFRPDARQLSPVIQLSLQLRPPAASTDDDVWL